MVGILPSSAVDFTWSQILTINLVFAALSKAGSIDKNRVRAKTGCLGIMMNVYEWGDMSTCGMLFQWASTIVIFTVLWIQYTALLHYNILFWYFLFLYQARTTEWKPPRLCNGKHNCPESTRSWVQSRSKLKNWYMFMLFPGLADSITE